MQVRNVGSNGIKVSGISLGLMGLGWHSQKQMEDNIKLAFNLGITTFDTANVYYSEHILASAMKNVNRDEYEIATKCFYAADAPTKNSEGLSRKNIIRSAEKSLKALNTDYIDFYMPHAFDPNTPMEEIVTAFDDLVRQGKVLHTGFSNWTADQISSALLIQESNGLRKAIFSSQPYNIFNRSIEKDIIPASNKYGMGQFAYAPLIGGLLSGKYKPGKPLPEGSRAVIQGGPVWEDQELLSQIENLSLIAEELNMNVSQLALTWVLQNRHISSVVIGSRTKEQIEDMARVGNNLIKLSSEYLQKIERAIGR